MQTRGGRGHGSRRVGINGLITLQIFAITLPAQIWRQRNYPAVPWVELTLEGNDPLAVGTDVFYLDGYAADKRLRATTHFPTWADQALPARRGLFFQEQKFDFAIIGKTARVHDAGIVNT